MSTDVVGFVPPDDMWKKQKAIWDACVAADVEVPESTQAFFDWSKPDDNGVLIELVDNEKICKEWFDEGRSGYEIDILGLNKAYPQLKFIRFYNSW